MKKNIKGAADFVDTSGTSPKQHQRRSNRIDRLAKAGRFEAMARKINRWHPGESSSKQLATVKEGAAQEIRDTGKDELKNVSELPGYQPIIGSSVNLPGRKKAVAVATAIATGVGAIIDESGVIGKLEEKWSKTKLYKKLKVVDEKAKVFDKKATEWIKNKFSGAPQGTYESPEIIHDADGALAGANALSGITDAIQIQALKNSKEGETDTETDTETSGSPRIVTYLRNIK